MSIVHNGLSGVLAAQVALSATSQNVANVMTPGYTRQGVLFASVQPRQSGLITAGAGVSAASLLRFSDGYKLQQMWSAASELGQRSAVQPYLTQLEQVMSIDGSGINSGLDAFFAALNAASVDPVSNPLRQQVITSAQALAQEVNSLGQLLLNQRAAVMQQRAAITEQVSTLAAEIALLNRQIVDARGTGINASGLIDARDRKIDELSDLVALQVVDQADGSRSVSLRDGQPLVIGSVAATMSVQPQPDGSQLLTVSFARETFTLTGTGLGGQLGGLYDLEYEVIRPMMQARTELAQWLTDGVNDVLVAGYTPDGNPGQPLFEFDATGAMGGTLGVRQGIVPQDLAFSSDPDAPGDSGNLLELIALRSQPVNLTLLGPVTLSDAVTQLVARLGMQSQQNQAALETAEIVRNQAEESWKSTSGVNLDEEAINLVQYQQMYQANMKVIAVANELLESTLAVLG